MNYGPEPEAGKAQTGGNDGNGNGGTGNDGNGSGDPFDLRVAEWALSAELMQMVQLQGEPLEELFVSFIKAALRKNADEDNIIKACLDHKSPYGGSIYKHVKAAGGENYVKQTIARIANALPTRTEREIIRLGFGGDTDKDWRKVEEILLQKKLPVYVRNGRLVQPLWRLHKNYDDDQKNYQYVLSVELARYSLIQLTDMIAHHAVQFQKWDKRMRDWRNIDPPQEIT
jgi:hypothetical protein